MCGFCGFTGTADNRETVLRTMTQKITHRGPDSEGYFITDETQELNPFTEIVSMGFRRLSIIDLDNGSQPLYNEDKSLALIFNGEIYNYKSIKAQLTEKGHIFTTETDSEVLLHGFEEWQENLLNRLRGMFAFVIWNCLSYSSLRVKRHSQSFSYITCIKFF